MWSAVESNIYISLVHNVYHLFYWWRCAHAAKSEDMRGESLHLELRRHYHCAAYNTLVALISCTQTEAKFYVGFLFTENVVKVRSIHCVRPLITKAKPTRAKFSTWMELGIVWPPTWLELAEVGSSGLNLVKLKFSPKTEPSFPPFGPLGQLSPICFVIVRWLPGRSRTIEWFSCELAATVWPPADASFDFITWLEFTWVGSTVRPGLVGWPS